MKILVLLSINILFANPKMEIVRQGNYVIAATTDGYVCYGTYKPKEVSCHEAIPAPTIK